MAAGALAGATAASRLAGTSPSTTFAHAGSGALQTLLSVYYGGNGLWNQCNSPNCAQTNSDWGADSLTYALYLRWATGQDSSIPPVMAALAATGPNYPGPCTLPSCGSWSDVPQWDTIADVREYQVTHDPKALAKAEAAFEFAEGSDAYALGACPDIRYQQPSGQVNHLKTLETDANAIKAAILLFQATGDTSYLQSATARYAAVRTHFLDPAVPLYSVYVFDDGQTCTQVPHRFFASVNGDMIWSGLELSKLTGTPAYLDESVATARAVASDLADPAGVFADLQAENDIVEPLVEGMYALATEDRAAFARAWILTNAAAALSDRAADGSYGRFFDGPAPRTTVTAWQTNGGLALEIAAAALDPTGIVAVTNRWENARRIARSVGPSGVDPFHRLGDRPDRHARRGLLRVRTRARLRRRARVVRRDRDLAGQVEPRPPDPGNCPLRLALAALRHARDQLRAGHPEREGRRLVPSPTGHPRAGLTGRTRRPAYDWPG